MAALKHRLEEEKADWIIYVTDSGQSQHFEQVRQGQRSRGRGVGRLFFNSLFVLFVLVT